MASLAAPHCFADSLDLAYGQIEQHLALQDETLLLKPAGLSVFYGHDINERWNIAGFYQTMRDDDTLENQREIELDLVSYGGTVNYYQQNWFFSAGVTLSDDEQNITFSPQNPGSREEDTEAVTLSTSLGYGGQSGNWLYDVSLGLQYSDWDIDTRVDNPPPPQEGQNPPPAGDSKVSDNSVSVNTSASLGHYWSLADNRGLMAGVMLSWSYIVSGDSISDNQGVPSGANNNGPRNPGGRNSGGRNGGASGLGATSGDDNYGQVLFYLAYDINNHWSLSLDGATELASDYSEQSWSINLGYAF